MSESRACRPGSPRLCHEESILEDEIDLRAYIAILLKYKLWIVAWR